MAQSKTTAIAEVDYSAYANLGLKGITAEDIRPPMAFLVQGIKDKTELVDPEGQKCPDGSYYMKGSGEIFESMPVYFVWVKKDHYQVKEGSITDERWDGSRMYRCIAIRADEMEPFAINFTKSSLGALNDLFTMSKSKNLPVFIFKCELRVAIKTNKEGQSYFVSVVAVQGVETDPEILKRLFVFAKGFDSQDEVPRSADEVMESLAAGEPELEPTETMIDSDIAAQVADDVPF
jgi:hypothetical protein